MLDPRCIPRVSPFVAFLARLIHEIHTASIGRASPVKFEYRTSSLWTRYEGSGQADCDHWSRTKIDQSVAHSMMHQAAIE
jgi:hypothetical protein